MLRAPPKNQYKAGALNTLSAISADTESARIYTTGMLDPDSLELHERVRFDVIVFQTLRVTESAFLEHKEALLSTELWESQWRGELKVLTTQGGRQSWLRQRELLSETYRKWVDENLPGE